MTDCEFLLSVLADGREHSLAEILRRSMDERGCGLTVHSRISDLRERGHVVEHSTVPGAERGHAHTYRLVGSLASPETLSGGDAPAGGSGDASDPCELTLFGPPPRGAYSEAA